MTSSGSPRILIVNADDFGLSRGVNAGVVEAFDNGILTSATWLANAPCFDEAVAIAKARPGLGVGVHLNLVRGQPLSPAGSVPLLIDGAGGLRPFRVRRLTDRFLSQAGIEYRRQIEKVLHAGVKPTHIDFEKHHAWQGPLYRVACGLAREYGIAAARTLREPVAWSVRKLGWPGMGKMLWAAFLRSGFDLGGGWRCGLHRPDRLLGQCHIGAMREGVWLALLRSLPPGVSEVMVHPGQSGGSGVDSASGEDDSMGESWLEGMREIELSALVSPRVRGAVDAAGVRLAHFGAVQWHDAKTGACCLA
ncbi:MAG: ChbG/HpnK family deacetylase [Planctomycetota bacterium]|jgi:predicted glycoside hydrolase/deacetylase ChbG (UPF0249 family)|nr:ChbG/HpnK family deacetylase [Planctomycetota bacterium]